MRRHALGRPMVYMVGLREPGIAMRPVMAPEELARALRRIGHEILERNQETEDVVLVGIHTRGVPLAGRIASLLTDVRGRSVPHASLDIGPYRDDLDTRPTTSLGPTTVPGGVDGKTVVLVDDVLFTGRTIRAAMDALGQLGRARQIQLAVLVDRGHRELPIRPDYIGKNLPTSTAERVTVHLTEIDGVDGVWIESLQQAERGVG